jgi:hypothetical protein
VLGFSPHSHFCLSVLGGGVVRRGSRPAPALPFLFAVWVVGSVSGLSPCSCPCLRFGTAGSVSGFSPRSCPCLRFGTVGSVSGFSPRSCPCLRFGTVGSVSGFSPRSCPCLRFGTAGSVSGFSPRSCPSLRFGTVGCGLWAVRRGSRPAPAPAFVSALWVAGYGQCVGVLAPLLPCLSFLHCGLWAVGSIGVLAPLVPLLPRSIAGTTWVTQN